MKTVFAMLAVLVSVGYSADSLNIPDSTRAISQLIIPAHIDSILPLQDGKTFYVPSTYNRSTSFIVNAWNPDSNKLKLWAKIITKNAAFRLPTSQKCVYEVKIRALRMDTSFVCPDPNVQ
jgi:hypothetical protein